MAARTEVTAQSVREYLDRTMTRDNYHLLYGLHLLTRDRFVGVMDALMNGDLQPEELVRLGSYTDAEADALLSQVLTGWTVKSVAAPEVGTEGYAYITQTLGVAAFTMDPIAATDGISPRRLTAARVAVGRRGHASLDEVEGIFRDRILPGALDGLPVSAYLPADESDLMGVPVTNSDDARIERLVDWLGPVLRPLIGPDDATLLRRLIGVGDEHCALREAPGLAEWILRAPRPGQGSKLLLHREAAVRSASGQYTLDELAAIVSELEESSLDHVGTANKLTVIEFKATVARAALVLHFPGEGELIRRSAVLIDVLDAMHLHRVRLRAFAKRVLAGCERHLIGDYPPA
jgi:hypothetical protein